MKPARLTSSTRRSCSNSLAAAAKAARSPWGTTTVGIPATSATFRPGAAARLLITSAISAGKPGCAQAWISACRLDPRPEIKTATLNRAIANLQLRRTFPPSPAGRFAADSAVAKTAVLPAEPTAERYSQHIASEAVCNGSAAGDRNRRYAPAPAVRRWIFAVARSRNPSGTGAGRGIRRDLFGD